MTVRPSADQYKEQGRRRAAGIYGAIVIAAVLEAAGGHQPTEVLAVSAIVTLLVYWLAEQYAEILGEQVTEAQLPSWPRIRDGLAASWPMVSASYLPLLALVLARVAGSSPLAAANVGLVVAIVVLTVHGWSAARSAHLKGWRLFAATAVALALGLVLIVLKNLVLVHLH